MGRALRKRIAFFAEDRDKELEEFPERGGGGAARPSRSERKNRDERTGETFAICGASMRSARFYARAREDAPRRHPAEVQWAHAERELVRPCRRLPPTSSSRAATPSPTVLDVMRAVGALGFERMRITELVEEYAKHTALNLGQALQGLRYLTSHPDIDAHAPRGTLRHAARSVALRSKRIVNDLFFATIPPHWHHTREELAAMKAVRIGRWFQYGYCAWRFEESGEPRATIDAEIDRRWDPRCRSSVVLDRDVD